MTGWRPLLRLAWRDVLRNKGRTVVVLLMIMIPVIGVSAASTIIATASVSESEGVGRNLGTADAVLGAGSVRRSTLAAQQAFLEQSARSVLGDDVRMVTRVNGSVRVATDKGASRVEATEADLRDPLFAGTYRLTEGRLPAKVGEVVVNADLADRGPGVGDDLEVRDGASLRIVGIAEDGYSKDPARAWALPGALLTPGQLAPPADALTLFVDAHGVVDRQVLERFDHEKVWVQSRFVSAAIEDQGDGIPSRGADVAVFVLIATMALTEVVLLAGPAFAVSARRRQRELALLGAGGATTTQVRAAVLASALVVGALAAALGLAGGLAGAWLALPVVQRFSSNWFGPFDLQPNQLLGVVAFGFVSAVLAAVVPAWIASRQDVVRVLSGRRGDPAPAKASPYLGVGLGVLGAVLTWIGVNDSGYGEIWIGFGAVATVVGAVCLLPVVLRVVAALTGRAPLVVRYALRDALRHRTRTVPAIGAVLATVAGVVALGIANASDQAAGERSYTANLPMGHGTVRAWSDWGIPAAEQRENWARVIGAARSVVPDLRQVDGVAENNGETSQELTLLRNARTDRPMSLAFDGPYPAGMVVAAALPDDVEVSAAERRRADAVLARGGVAVLDRRGGASLTGLSEVTLRNRTVGMRDGEQVLQRRAVLPHAAVEVDATPPYFAVVSPEAARAVRAEIVPVELHIDREVSAAEQDALDQAVTAVTDQADVYVERGYQPDAGYLIAMLVLTAVGTLLMVGGTLTATVLALADAGPDLATLSAVGAAPRTRRAVAMATAFVIGGVGAVLGALVGFVPGLAATWPLTSNDWAATGGGAHTVAIPWLQLAAVVVGVPVLLSLAVGLFSRSRLPVVSRVD